MDRLAELYYFLEGVPEEDRTNLQTVIGASFGNSPKCLCDHFIYLRDGAIGQIFSPRSYKKLVTDVADRVGIDWNSLCQGRTWEKLKSYEIENTIVVKVFSEIYEKLSDDKKIELRDELNRLAQDKDFGAEIITASGIILARLSGFQIYLLATTALGALSGALGITLPFVIYTTLTRSISIVIGPIGWVALGILTVFHLNQPNWSKLIPGIVYISYLRNKQ